MAFFKKVFQGKPLKRIEIKAGSPKFRIRASRTGGLNAAIHPLRGLTYNTKHGLRMSKTFKGLTLGFQGGNTVVRGRWSSENGLLNLNLSKSGFTLSSRSKHGTYNITRPNRSSFKFAGIQLRGKKAAVPALIFTILTLIPILITSIFSAIEYLFQALILLLKLIINIFIIVFRIFSVIYEFLLLIFVDVPKQIINNIFKKQIFDVSPDIDTSSNIASSLSSADDASAEVNTDLSSEYESLIDRRRQTKENELKDIEKKLKKFSGRYTEVTFLKKLLFIGMFLVGALCFTMIFSIIVGILNILSSNNTLTISMSSFLIVTIFMLVSGVCGYFLCKPYLLLRQHRKLQTKYSNLLESKKRTSIKT